MNNLVGLVTVIMVMAAVLGIGKLLHTPGACYVGKAALSLGSPC